MMWSQLGKWIILIGLIIVLIGGIVWLFGDKLSWIGRLPGDIRYEGDNVNFYFPITTMILLSLLLSFLMSLITRLFN